MLSTRCEPTRFCSASSCTAPPHSSKPFDWHWAAKLAIYVGGSMPILLVTYHWFVRFTWIGALLNGRRHPRPEKPPPSTAAEAA